MLYYLLFWTILGFIFQFYIIFGANLLTGGPTQNCCFFAHFSVSEKQNIKRSPNGMKPSGTRFSHQIRPRRLGPSVKKATRRSRGWTAPPPLGHAPCLMGPSKLHRHTPSSYIYLRTPKRSEHEPKPNSTAATFCIHEIPSWGLFRSSAGRGSSLRRASTSS